MRGMKLLHLTTTGRKSGKPHIVEIYGFENKSKLVVIASYGGRHVHPEWFLNLRDEPEVKVKVGKELYRATAKIAGPKLRATLWAELSKLNSHYDDFQRKTKRQIPVVVLHPQEAG
jgi:deazaflavin-dependent oxidoreductase (nitroreductase family)